MSILTQMFDDFYAEIQGADLSADEKSFYVQRLPELINALSPLTQGQPWEQLLPRLSDVALERLDAADMRLRVLVNEEELEASEFAELLNEISEILQMLENTITNSEVRDFVTTQLLRVKQAVDEYRFRGIKGFREALAGFVGAISVVKKQSESSISEQDSSANKLLLDKLNKIGGIASSIITLCKSTPWVWKHLLLPTGERIAVHIK